MKVSIVICTLNRADSLHQTLESLRQQTYSDFEVVVVNGPSTDHTEEVLDGWRDMVRSVRCPVPNLSVSRNIGIRSAAGDVVAFIDDDALPEFDWLVQALSAFGNPEVAGVGGIVFDHTGMALQYCYSAANRFGEAESRSSQPYDELCVPGAFRFPYLQGTNALFRRSAVLEVGGFDEVYDYYLDETDLCCRLVDAGYVLRQLPNAAVHHKFLPSGIRDYQRVVTNWFPIMKNQAYFSYRHAFGSFSEFQILEHSRAFLQKWIDDARFHEDAGRLAPGSSNAAADTCGYALRIGTQLGIERHGLELGPVDWPAPQFERFPTADSSARRKITMVTSTYTPHVSGGIARFMSELAPALARRGHEVRVITRAFGPSAVDLEDGVWVHRIDVPDLGGGGIAPTVLPHINAFLSAAADEVLRISTWSSHDVVYGPMWDAEVLGVLRTTALPVAVQVATPLAIAAEMAGHLDDPAAAAELHKVMALEQEILQTADLFHANSRAVASTIADRYLDQMVPDRWQIVHLGLADRRRQAACVPPPMDEQPDEAAGTGELTVLFVGRFELRKGIDTFLQAAESIARRYPLVRFVVAGEDRPLHPGEPDFGQSWRRKHAEEPWSARVHFCGEISDDTLHDLYGSADLVVLPSRYESFGLAMVEAMMHGRALVSCDTSGIRDVVRNGVDGVLVEPGDAQALAQAMRGLLDDPERRSLLGDAGRRRFTEAFHIDAFAERFDRFLTRMRLIDASEAQSADSQPLRLHRGSSGRSAARLVVGQGLWFRTARGSVARLVIATEGTATVRIDDGDVRVLDVVGRATHRVPVSSASGRVGISVVEGSITIDGLLVVGPDSGAGVAH